MANQAIDGNGRIYCQALNTAEDAFEAVHQTSNAMHVHLASGAAALDAAIQGDTAHDAADAGSPVKIGFKAADPASMPANVSANDRVNGVADLAGRQIVTMNEVFGTPASAVVAKGVQVAGSDGTNARLIKTDSSGNLVLGATSETIVAGKTAADAAIAANPVTVGGRGSTATPSAVNADGDVVNAWFDLNGRLNVKDALLYTASVATTGAAHLATALQIAGSDGTNARLLKTDTTGSMQIIGEIAHDAADSGNPIKIGGKATATVASAVAANDRVNASYDLYGRARVMPAGENKVLFASAAVTADATETAITGFEGYSQVQLQMKCSAAASTANDKMNVYIDTTFDGTNWINIAQFTELLGNGGAKEELYTINPGAMTATTPINIAADAAAGAARHILGDRLRARFDITDDSGSASFTIAVNAFCK